MSSYATPPVRTFHCDDDVSTKLHKSQHERIARVPQALALPSLACRSAELRAAVDVMVPDKMLGLEFSVTLADPGMPDCPLIACSLGFSRMTGYKLHDIIGKNCLLLEHGVPDELVNDETCRKTRAFCSAAAGGYGQQQPGDIPEALKLAKPHLRLGNGEELYVQTNAKQSGELFCNMVFLKTVDLDDRPFIISVQAGLGEECVSIKAEDCFVSEFYSEAFANLNRNMNDLEALLASHFQYSSAMRRID